MAAVIPASASFSIRLTALPISPQVLKGVHPVKERILRAGIHYKSKVVQMHALRPNAQFPLSPPLYDWLNIAVGARLKERYDSVKSQVTSALAIAFRASSFRSIRCLSFESGRRVIRGRYTVGVYKINPFLAPQQFRLRVRYLGA